MPLTRYASRGEVLRLPPNVPKTTKNSGKCELLSVEETTQMRFRGSKSVKTVDILLLVFYNRHKI